LGFLLADRCWNEISDPADDQSGNVSRATYNVYDQSGGLAATNYIDVSDIANLAALDPIAAFQVNIVGPVNGESAIFSSGAGLITYSAQNEFVPSAVLPPTAEAQKINTLESANTAYGFLPSAPNTTFSQSFQVFAYAS
jgi:hypothetical protein